MNSRFLLFVSLLFMLASQASSLTVDGASGHYFKSRVGCLTPESDLMELECTDHKLAFKILDTLNRSRRKDSDEQMRELIYKRARYFLNRQEYDYFSVLSLMIFPIDAKEKWLEEFKSIPGKRVPYTEVALEFVRDGKSDHCKKSKLKFYVQEICSFSPSK